MRTYVLCCLNYIFLLSRKDLVAQSSWLHFFFGKIRSRDICDTNVKTMEFFKCASERIARSRAFRSNVSSCGRKVH